MKLIVPTIPKDIGKLLRNIDTFFKYLPISEIDVIGAAELEPLLPDNYPIVFINEDKLVDFPAVRNLIVRRTKNEKAGARAGWYVQQFIKMAYARICPDDYYLLWDSDTVPLKLMHMTEGDKPIFHLKTGYHAPYFKTIENLFPSLRKEVDGSFISEHMIIKTGLMREMLAEIEANDGLEGDNFAEKILNAVPVESLSQSGFSEFETYGTYVHAKNPDAYGMRSWNSLRFGGFFFDSDKVLGGGNARWLSRSYDAVSLEKGDNLSPVSRIVTSPLYQKVFGANTLEFWAFLIRACRKIRGRR